MHVNKKACPPSLIDTLLVSKYSQAIILAVINAYIRDNSKFYISSNTILYRSAHSVEGFSLKKSGVLARLLEKTNESNQIMEISTYDFKQVVW